MSGIQGSSNPTSNSSNPETASIASYSSSSALLKNNKPKPAPIDAKKLQEQALKSQIRFCM